jgi:hypothetical protein
MSSNRHFGFLILNFGSKTRAPALGRCPNAKRSRFFNPKSKIQNLKSDRGVILPVVLIMIGLLALTMTSFMFFVRAEMSGIRAENDGQQARLAAESGLEEITALLRAQRHDPSAWYDKPDGMRHSLVYGEGFDRQSDPAKQARNRGEYLSGRSSPTPGWRWTAVATRPDAAQGSIRFGITPESGKLNLNTASDRQITELLTPLLIDLGVQNHLEIINSILDWRDGDSSPRPDGAETDYYNTLTPPYNCKNGRFDTVEELLIVKGITAAILYGEDTNRNGILDPNEDDGDASEPRYDNADGKLNVGIAEFLTVFARDVDTALDNKPRINLNTGPAVAAQIAKVFTNNELSPATIAFLSGLSSQGINPAMLRSPADLLPPGQDETPETLFANPEQPPASQPAAQQEDQEESGDRSPGGRSGRSGSGDDGAGKKDGDQDNGGASPTGGSPRSGSQTGGSQPGGSRTGGSRTGGSRTDGSTTGGKGGANKSTTHQDKSAPPDTPGKGGPIRTPGKGGPQDTPGKGDPGTDDSGGGRPSRGGQRGPGADDGKPPTGDGEKGPQGGDGSGQPRGGQRPGGRGGPGGRGQQQATPEQVFNALRSSPLTIQELPYIMDRFSVRQVQQAAQPIEGLININTAPARVLSLIPGITPDAVASIMGMRATQPYEVLKTTAWPLTTGALDAITYKRIAPYVTTKSYQFHVEVLGYADHVKTMRRLEWVIEMIGPMAQVKYHRDLTELGIGFPIDSEQAIVETAGK